MATRRRRDSGGYVHVRGSPRIIPVDAREADLRVAFVHSLRGIADRNLAAADAIDKAIRSPLA
ncbi:MAG: hypothetical protein IID44_00875 [Planctomycetes bacterium]|nr:hypothetical protein [Planctomycetota bacterium]